MKTVQVVVGTRPEAIKMAPVYRALQARPGIRTQLVSTGQHRELLAQAFRAFGLRPDADLSVMTHGQSLSSLTATLLERLAQHLAADRPDLILVHGDTTTCFATALSAFYHGVPVAHVEAGLRTHRLDSPFPEEFNRQCVARLASFHFAPDEVARANLLREGVEDARIHVTGTTVVDALAMLPRDREAASDPVSLITLHRREKGEAEFREILRAIAEAVAAKPEEKFIYPVHPSPVVRRCAQEVLSRVSNVTLTEPMAYGDFLRLLARARLVLTDSGGIQEEAAYFGRRVLILRDHTERQDGLAGGLVSLVGTTGAGIRQALAQALATAPEEGISQSRAAPLEDAPSPSCRIAQTIQRRIA